MTRSIRTEIGSNFEYHNPINSGSPTIAEYLTLPMMRGIEFTFSGRAALGIIIDEIIQKRELSNAYLPSYSCASMVQPFLERNIEVEYYLVDYCNGELEVQIDTSKEPDIFLYMDYFGSTSFLKAYEEPIEIFKNKGTKIIHDVTHGLFSEGTFTSYCDYATASLRKWFAIPAGGVAYKRFSEFTVQAKRNSDELIKQKLDAMVLKKEYLNGENINKQIFLKSYKDFNSKLTDMNQYYDLDLYSKKYISEQSLTPLIQTRHQNASFIYQNLSENDNLSFLYSEVDLDFDVPLFVPVVVKNGYRDKLRSYLIDHQIYLPVHWPQYNNFEMQINNIELSLVCDQRYNINDMSRMINLINQWVP